MFKNRLSREIAALLCIKLAALCVIYYAFFSGPAHVDAYAASSRILQPDSPF